MCSVVAKFCLIIRILCLELKRFIHSGIQLVIYQQYTGYKLDLTVCILIVRRIDNIEHCGLITNAMQMLKPCETLQFSWATYFLCPIKSLF